MKVLAADIEANGLVHATKVHCGVVEDVNTGERHVFTDPLELYNHLLTADRLTLHNGRMYDCPTLERLVGRPNNLPPLPPCFDTLLTSRLLWPDKGNTPAGGHGLGKWARFLGKEKLHTDIEDWSEFTPEMLERCHSDVDAQVALYKYITPKCRGWGHSVQLEHTVASIIQHQIENGFSIDVTRMEKLDRDLDIARLEQLEKLNHIEPWVEHEVMKKPAYYLDPFDGEKYKLKGDAPASVQKRLEKGPPYVKETEILFSPGSDHHVRRFFKEKYNWTGTVMTKGGKDGKNKVESVAGDVLATLDFPEAKAIHQAAIFEKLQGYMKSWKEKTVNGKIHGSVNTNGTVAGRMSHSDPNLGQIPSVDKPFGTECRALFKARDGFVLVGMDASGLEARMLGHYVAEFDGGSFARRLETSDIHSVNQELAELDTRAEAKTFYFKFVYGGNTDPVLEKRLYAACPALRTVKERILKLAERTGFVTLIDGRKVPVRKRPLYGHEKTDKEVLERRYGIAVNNVLQGAGGVVMKKALCFFFEDAEEAFGPHGERWGLCANVHDEFQTECEPEIADHLGKMMVDSLEKAARFFNLRIKLDGEYKVGNNWAETH